LQQERQEQRRASSICEKFVYRQTDVFCNLTEKYRGQITTAMIMELSLRAHRHVDTGYVNRAGEPAQTPIAPEWPLPPLVAAPVVSFPLLCNDNCLCADKLGFWLLLSIFKEHSDDFLQISIQLIQRLTL
jgi:hypothetical protein